MIENQRARVFRAVAKHLNFSRAAEELFLTQPAVTQQIKTLEEEFGAALFDRRGGNVTLTPAGEALLPFAQKMKELSDKAHAAVMETSGERGGEMHLGASQTIADYFLPKFLAAFLTQHPKIQVKIRSGNTDEVLEDLSTGLVEMVLIEGPAQRKGLDIQAFMTDRMVLAVPPDHAWAQKEIVIDDLREHPLLMREFGAGSRRVIEQALYDAGLKKHELHIGMEIDTTEGLLSAIEAGLGVGFASQRAVRNRLRLGTVKTARIHKVDMLRRFSVVCSLGPEPLGALGAFRHFLLTDPSMRTSARDIPT